MDKGIEVNRRVWDEWAQINVRSEMYKHDAFLKGRNSLHALELGEVGDVAGKRLLHLMCHFGHDSLSWARLGADVTAADFSPEAIAIARQSSEQIGVPARFICSNLYELPQHLDETFDIVYTSYGVLTWLPNLEEWARIAASYVKPGGFFYIAEFHPTAMIFDDEADSPIHHYPYFNEGPIILPVSGTYADRQAETKEKETYEWSYPLGEVITNLINSGLRIEYVHEFPYSTYQAYDWLEKHADGNYYPRAGIPSLPLIFSLKAVKPA